MSDIVKEILRVVSSSLQIPTIIILILLILLTILMLGSFVAEIFTERKSLKMNIPGLVDQLQGKDSAQMKEAIENSDLLNRQKESCRELINRVSYNDDTREALARQLIADEEMRYGKIVKITDLISRVAPMFGLMGTLIPLGPGLIALGQGDTSTLSGSLLIAFDTTVAGLISGAISYVVSGIRKGWYEEYMIGLETIMETILDVQGDEREKAHGQLRGAGKPQAPKTPAAAGRPAGAQPQARPQQGAARPQQPQTGAIPQGNMTRPQAPQAPQGGAVRPQTPQPQARPQQEAPAAPAQVIQPQQITPQQVSPARATMTEPVHPQAPAMGAAQMSRNTQTQEHHAPAEPNSKTDHTMVQRTFQEEVRAAEEAMLEAQRQAEQEQIRQVLSRPKEQ